MFAPEVLRHEMNFYDEDIGEQSIDHHLDTTDKLREWARKKGEGTNLDPVNRKPIQVSQFLQKFLFLSLVK